MTPLEQLLFLLNAVPRTLSISIFSFVLGFVIGVPMALMRIYGWKEVRILADGYEKVFRGVPVLVVMLFIYFGLGGIFHIFKDPYLTAILSLGLASGANQSQIFRSAIGSVGKGQMMAAMSLGLPTFKAVRYVVLPQAFIVAVPGLGSEIALLIKDSSYSFIIGVLELMKHADILKAATQDRVFPYIATALIYIMLTFPFANYLDKWGSKKKRELGI